MRPTVQSNLVCKNRGRRSFAVLIATQSDHYASELGGHPKPVPSDVSLVLGTHFTSLGQFPIAPIQFSPATGFSLEPTNKLCYCHLRLMKFVPRPTGPNFYHRFCMARMIPSCFQDFTISIAEGVGFCVPEGDMDWVNLVLLATEAE